MSSIVSGMNAERNNRWLLIGAAVLAVVAGVLVFVALANLGGDDDSPANVSTGSSPVLIAEADIEAGTRLNADMFRTATFAEEDLVVDSISNPEAVVGMVTRQNIIEGQQLSRVYLGQPTSQDDLDDQLAFVFAQGLRGIGVSTDAVRIVGGHAIPGDRVDVIWNVREKDNINSEQEFLRVETILQNIEILARTDEPVQGVVVLDAEGNPKPIDESDMTLERRSSEVEPADDAGHIVLALSPEQVQTLQMAIDLGEVTFALRAFGDENTTPIPPVRVPIFD